MKLIFNRSPANTRISDDGAVYYYLILKAFKLAEARVAVHIAELGTLIPVIGGIILLKEKREKKKSAKENLYSSHC